MYELNAEIMGAITDLRVSGPERLEQYFQWRPRREKLTEDGRLVILAADHPARMVTAVGDDPIRMGNRAEYLGRIVRVLQSDGVDGLMGTPDILEEIMTVDALRVDQGLPSLLAGRLLVGCMNRGGLAGTVFEMEDTFTAYTVDQMVRTRVDAAKMMLRLEPLESASGRTVTACAQAINDCVDAGLPVFLEPLMVSYRDGKYIVDNSVDAMVKTCGVASGLGKSSWKTWMKVPVSVDFARVAAATSCPILLLGGPSTGDPAALVADFERCLNAADNVRGALVGRNVLYPGDADPADVARAVGRVVHG